MFRRLSLSAHTLNHRTGKSLPPTITNLESEAAPMLFFQRRMLAADGSNYLVSANGDAYQCKQAGSDFRKAESSELRKRRISSTSSSWNLVLAVFLWAVWLCMQGTPVRL